MLPTFSVSPLSEREENKYCKKTPLPPSKEKKRRLKCARNSREIEKMDS